MQLPKILVFIPAYNCEAQISRVLRQFNQEVSPWFDTLLIVNNLSTDNTEKSALDSFPGVANLNLVLLRNDQNYGLGGSHKVAFQYAIEHGFDYVVTLHGDDQANIADLLPLLHCGELQQFDVLLGARFMQHSKLAGYSQLRAFGNQCFNRLFSVVTGVNICDLGSGLNCYSTKMLQQAFYHNFADDLTFNYCMILAHAHYRHRIQFFPLTWRETDQVSNVDMPSQTWSMLSLLCRYWLNPEQLISSEIRKEHVTSYTYQVIATQQATDI